MSYYSAFLFAPDVPAQSPAGAHRVASRTPLAATRQRETRRPKKKALGASKEQEICKLRPPKVCFVGGFLFR